MKDLCISDFCETGSGGTPNRSRMDEFYHGGTIPWVKSGELASGEVTTTEERITESGLKGSATKLVESGAILMAMYGATVGQVATLRVSAATNQAVCYILPDQKECVTEYLYQFLRSKRNSLLDLRVGGGQPNISQGIIKAIRVPLPPLSEQTRIAAILDKADAIRRKLQQSLRLSDDFLRSVFLDMFGDPVTNSKRWPSHTLTSVIGASFRNGLSPSTSGTVAGKVLTLSAVTSGTFAPQFLRDAIFDRTPSENQQVTRNTFLICRGNGNKSMVGIGVFPEANMPSVSFPDTMIACTIDRTQIEPEYLQAMWSTAKVRKQIDAGARTTNGTYKVNQTLLGGIEFPLPPLEIQKIFSGITQATRSQSARTTELAAASETLFSSLQQRAFRGEL